MPVQRVMQEGPTAQLPELAHVVGLAEQRRVVLSCEKAIVLLDIISKRVQPPASSSNFICCSSRVTRKAV